MKNKEKEIQSQGTEFKPQAQEPATAAAVPRPGGPVPLRKSVSNGSIGLLVALAGLFLSPFGDSEYAAVGALASAVIIWQLLSAGLGRIHPTSLPLKPYGGVLALVAGGLCLSPLVEDGGSMGAFLALFGGVVAVFGQGVAKKADAKLPPAAAEIPVDGQFSKSLLAYLLIILSLPLAWSDGGGTGLNNILGGLTFLFCLLCLWGSWVGMWKLWSMPAISAGMLGLVLFLAPLEAVFLGLLGVSRVFVGDSMELLETAWPRSAVGPEDLSILYVLGPLLCLIGGSLATFELFHGAKKGLEANKQKKEAEIAARKAARAARRGDAAGAASGDPAKK